MPSAKLTPYTTQDKIEGYIDRPLSKDEAALLPTLVGGVSDIIDNYCNRSFSKDRNKRTNNANIWPNSNVSPPNDPNTGTVQTYQTFDGGEPEYFFDSPLQVSGSTPAPSVYYQDMDVGQLVLLTTDTYRFFPSNGNVKTSVMRTLGVFPYGIQNIFVFGTFSDYLTPPDAIQLAATIICADIINLPDGLTAESIEGYSRTLSHDWNPTIQKVLNIYRRVSL